MLARQRPDRLALPLGDAVHHELGEGATVVGNANGGVPGAGQRAHRTDDHLQHVPDRQLAGDREHGRADPAEHLVLVLCRAGRHKPQCPSGVLAHTCDVTAVTRAGDRAQVLRPLSVASRYAGPMPGLPVPPNVAGMTETPHVSEIAPQAGRPGRVAVVTGASRGLGRALARALAEDGYRLVVDARDGAALRQAMAGLPASAVVTALPGDVTDPAHRADLRRAADALGGPDLLINNAGTLGPSPLPAVSDFPLGELRTAFEVNVIAPLALTQLLLPALRARGGAVLSVTSDAAVEAYAGWGGYGAAKAALEQACNVLAAEEVTVRVWRVDPGDLRTDMHQLAFPGEDISDRPLPESVVPAFRRLIAERMPSGRYRAADLMPATAGATTEAGLS